MAKEIYSSIKVTIDVREKLKESRDLISRRFPSKLSLSETIDFLINRGVK